MKKILLIGTGGTIASEVTESGLAPELTSAELLARIPAISGICDVDCIQILNLDSTDIGPRHWMMMARCIRERYDDYDGFVLTHGTDTMAYTAAALSYLVQGSPKPIILTGAQKPIGFDSTDSKINLTDALRCAAADLPGVSIVFNSRVILGTRARKTRTKSFQAFSSINYPNLGVLRDGVLLRYIRQDCEAAPHFYDALNTHVALMKLTPGVDRAQADFLLPSEGSDLGVYHVGHALKNRLGVLEAYDMTTEAVVAKLMWILARTRERAEVERLFYTPVARDILWPLSGVEAGN